MKDKQAEKFLETAENVENISGNLLEIFKNNSEKGAG
jgi:hypothetical protein